MAQLAPSRSDTLAAKRDDYLTDGKRLVMVRRKMVNGSWMVEDASTDPTTPTLHELGASELRSGAWRRVALVELPDG